MIGKIGQDTRTALLTALLTLAAGGVTAQSGCGDSHEIKSGDTLAAIARSCDTTVERIVELNPDLDPRGLQIGTVVRLLAEAGSASETEAEGTSDGEAGTADTGAEAEPDSGDIDDGETRFTAPEDDTLIFELDTDDSVAFTTGPVEGVVQPSEDLTLEGLITREGECPDPVGTEGGTETEADPPANCAETVTLQGRVEEGVECRLLVTLEGESHALTGDAVADAVGKYVEVSGTPAEVSICMQGQSTINVTTLREIEPPKADSDDPDTDE